MKFIPFENVEDAFQWMKQNEEQAMEELLPFQRPITWGDYWVRAVEGIFVFGRIMTEDEVAEGEREAGAEPEELDFTMKTIREAHERGYRYGKAYSVIVPDGEYGSTHIAHMIPITKELFELAKSYDWYPDAEVLVPIMEHLDGLRREFEQEL